MSKGFFRIARWLAQPKVALLFVAIMILAIVVGADIVQNGGPWGIAAVWFAFVPLLLLSVAVGSIMQSRHTSTFIATLANDHAVVLKVRLESRFRPPCFQSREF